jgi:hypothetical protein
LVRAHKGRARPVAFFHVLRQPALEPDDHAFLTEHIDELGASDLLRWRARCEEGFSGPVIRRLALLAIADPAYFSHDVLDVPRLELAEEEWVELADLVRGKVPAAVYERLVERRRRESSKPLGLVPVYRFLDGSELHLDAAPEPAARAPAAPVGSPRDMRMADLLAARREGALAIDDGALLALAMDRARAAATEDWSFAVLDFPAALGDAIFEKARRTGNDAERANLLAWLEAHGVPRSALLEVALAAIRGGEVSFGLLAWLTRQLATRAAWDKHGLDVLSALMARRAFSEIGELCTIAWSEAGHGGAEPPRALLEAMQVALALALLGLSRQALERGDDAGALAALSALACLDPPSRVSRAVHDLWRAPGISADVAALVAVNERLVKHSDARDASLEGVIAAVHAIADASSAGARAAGPPRG